MSRGCPIRPRRRTAWFYARLGTLRDDGLILTRRGRGGGSFVRAPLDGGRAALLVRLSRVGLGELRDLADHYCAISGHCAALAAERADPDDITRLRRLAALHPDEPHGIRRHEGTFHLEVAATAQSARLTREEMALQREIGPVLWLADLELAQRPGACPDPGGDRGTVEAHRAIVEAVKTLHRITRRRRNR